MRTLVASDLHLGGRTGVDVLRDPAAREPLLEALDGVDRLVLLGDVLELRHGPAAEAVAEAEPVLSAIAGALPSAAEVVVVAGNHDHALVAPWLEARALDGRVELGLEEAVDPGPSALAGAVKEALGGERVRFAYPGVWLRDDVYATHGHYLDCHLTVPTFERLAAGIMSVRVTGGLPDRAAPRDYERVLGPIYAWMHVVARHDSTGFGVGRATASSRAWEALAGSGPRPLRARALAAAFPLAVGGLNRLRLGPLHHDLSGPALRRAGLAAMAEVARHLHTGAEWVLFGHTHRGGPLRNDHAAEWSPPGVARLVNTGSWVHEPVFLRGSGPENPYWPGGLVEVDDEGPPRRRRLLGDWRPATTGRRPA